MIDNSVDVGARNSKEFAATKALWGKGVVATLAALLTVATWAFASPISSSPDDGFHVASIWCASARGAAECEFVADVGRGQSLHRVGPGGATAPVIPPGFMCHPQPLGNEPCPPAEAGGEVRVNSGLYPPVFYRFAGLFVSDSVHVTVLRVRLAVGASVVVLLALSWLVAATSLRPAMLVSWMVMSMPLGVFLFASTNPSAWGIAGVAAYWGVLLSALKAPSPGKAVASAAVMIGATVMASGARSDAAAYIVVITVVSLGLLLRRRDQIIAGVAAGVCLLIAMATVLVSGQTQNVTEGFNVIAPRDRSFEQIAVGIMQGVPSLLLGGTGAPYGRLNEHSGALGWTDVPMPPTTWMVMLLILGALVFTGLSWLPAKKALALVALTVAALVLPSIALIRASSVPGEEVQPRYILPLAFAIVGVTLLRSAAQPMTWNIAQRGIVVLGLWVAGSMALLTLVDAYSGVTGLAEVAPDTAWMWPPLTSPLLLWGLGTAAWGVLVWIGITHSIPVSRKGSDR